MLKIIFPTPLSAIKDVTNDNIDVLVETEKERYSFTVETVKNLTEPCWMSEEGYVVPSAPFLIVEKLTEESVSALINAVLCDKKLADLYGKDIG